MIGTTQRSHAQAPAHPRCQAKNRRHAQGKPAGKLRLRESAHGGTGRHVPSRRHRPKAPPLPPACKTFALPPPDLVAPSLARKIPPLQKQQPRRSSRVPLGNVVLPALQAIGPNGPTGGHQQAMGATSGHAAPGRPPAGPGGYRGELYEIRIFIRRNSNHAPQFSATSALFPWSFFGHKTIVNRQKIIAHTHRTKRGAPENGCAAKVFKGQRIK